MEVGGAEFGGGDAGELDRLARVDGDEGAGAGGGGVGGEGRQVGDAGVGDLDRVAGGIEPGDRVVAKGDVAEHEQGRGHGRGGQRGIAGGRGDRGEAPGRPVGRERALQGLLRRAAGQQILHADQLGRPRGAPEDALEQLGQIVRRIGRMREHAARRP